MSQQQIAQDDISMLNISNPWNKADTRFCLQPRIRLIHERADVFGAITQWMWGGGALDSRHVAERSWNLFLRSETYAADSMVNALWDMYLMASRLRIRDLETDVLKQLKRIFSTAHAVMTPKLVDRILDKTQENSPLRKVLVTSLARSFRLPTGTPPRDFQHVFKRYPEFAMAMINAGFGWD